MNPVLAELIKTEKFKDYLERIKNTNAPIAILGLAGVGVEQIASCTETELKRPI